MKKIICSFICFSLLATNSFASFRCFFAKKEGEILLQEGDCVERRSSCSTFKIAISLMGFDSGVLVDENTPQWEYKEEYNSLLPCVLDAWKGLIDPLLWMKTSTVWYSQVITQKLGMERFQSYVDSFEYGNLNTSGDRGRDNGLTHCWLLSSLLISPIEQVEFLEKLLNNNLPVSLEAQELTKNILLVEEIADGWRLYGKTGGDYQKGWFVGWIQKDDHKIVFAHYIEEDNQLNISACRYARELAKEKLLCLIEN